MDVINCMLCDSKNTRVYIKHQKFEIIYCNSCGLYFQFTPKQFETLENIYNNIYEEKFRLSKNNKYMKKRMSVHYKDIQMYQKKIGNLLDVGCSYGVLMEFFIQKGWKATGIDISENALSYAKSKGLECYNTRIEDFQPKIKFDVIVMSNVLEHLEKPINSLKCIQEWLSPGGIIYIRVPNVKSIVLLSKYQSFLGDLKPFEHLFYFSVDTLKLLLEKVGLKCHIKTDGRINIGNALNCYIRSKIVLQTSWQKLSYKTKIDEKKKYLFLKHIYGEILTVLGYISIGAKNREIVAIASRNNLD